MDAKTMKVIFDTRNQIIHEMDIRLDAKDKQARKRRSRTIDDMNEYADSLLKVGHRVGHHAISRWQKTRRGAMSLGRPVIRTCRTHHLDDAHFNTRQYNHITWERPAGLRQKLADRMHAIVRR